MVPDTRVQYAVGQPTMTKLRRKAEANRTDLSTTIRAL